MQSTVHRAKGPARLKILRDLTEASLSGARLSIMAALAMMFLFGMVTVSTSTSVIVDKSSDGDFLRIEFNISFPALPCEFASLDVSDVLGTNRLNVTKTIRKFPIGTDLRPTGSEFHSGPVLHNIKQGDGDEYSGDGSISLTAQNFVKFTHHPEFEVYNSYLTFSRAPMVNRYDPEIDGRILMAKVDCTEEGDLCRRNEIHGYPSLRIFRKGGDVRDNEHESYYGCRETDSLVEKMESLVASIPVDSEKLAMEGKSDNRGENAKIPAPLTGGCRIEGYVRVKKVPGNLVISAHSFDASQLNISHIISHFSFGRMIAPKVMSDVKRLVPYLGASHDRLNGRSFINHRDLGANVTMEHYLQIVDSEVVTGRSHNSIEKYEYTALGSLVQSLQIPVAKFHFELSPMQV
ncbi:hypothetical protein DVH24_003448 [Malus domestica]|uniref:Thioredoxin domain-containing protein n=1 Tax=Malus domestica TaxID=3750 RepID=A0A498IIC7_MALDO|nr:hypothetical protein DVH24_003448 [Malus domestica]